MDNWPLFWGPALVEEMKNELAPKTGASTCWQKEKKNEPAPKMGASTHWAKRKNKQKTNPQMGAVLVKQNKKKKKKKPPNRGSAHWAKERKKKNKWLAPKMGASTCWVKEKIKRNLQMGAVLVKQRKEEKKKMNDWPPKQGPLFGLLRHWGHCLLSWLFVAIVVVCCCHCGCFSSLPLSSFMCDGWQLPRHGPLCPS